MKKAHGMSEPETREPEVSGEDSDAPTSFLRSTIAPAVAMVILYASIRSLPSLLMSQTPPVNGEHLLVVFLISLVIFYLFGLYNDRKRKRKGPSE